MRAKRTIGALVFTVAVVNASAAYAQQPADPRVADLVQSGKLRVALGLGSPVLAMKDANTGEVRGPALDLAQALAKKIGVKLEPVEYPRPGAILAGVKNNEWDVTFLVADPARLAEADFSPPIYAERFYVFGTCWLFEARSCGPGSARYSYCGPARRCIRPPSDADIAAR